MFVLGLTGGIGSGKSTVAHLFGELGVHRVDADEVARAVVEPGESALTDIGAHFGADVIRNDGSLDRAALRARIFEHPEEKQWLEALLHPLIRRRIVRELSPTGYDLPYIILVSPLLLETDQHSMVDRVLVVDVDEEHQVQRTMARDGNDEALVRRIMATQMSREERLGKADFVVDNRASSDQLKSQVESIHRQVLMLAQGHQA